MARKKARIKADTSWPLCWCRLGCGCSVGVLFFLCLTLATSLFIYLVVVSSLPPDWQMGCQHSQWGLPDQRTEKTSGGSKAVKSILPPAARPWNWKPQSFKTNRDLNNISDTTWINFMRSLGLISQLERQETALSKTDNSEDDQQPNGCSEKCLSSHEVSPFRQWMLLFRALAMFKILWDRQTRHCDFVLGMEKTLMFYRTKTFVVDTASEKHIKIEFDKCTFDVNGTTLRAPGVFDAVMEDVIFGEWAAAGTLLNPVAVKELTSRMTISCGKKMSCLKADITLDPLHYTHTGTVRRLLTVVDDAPHDETYSYPVALISGVSSFLIIFIAILCVCNKKTSTSYTNDEPSQSVSLKMYRRNDDPDILLKQVTPRVDRRSTNLEACAVPVNNERHSVHVTIEEKRKSAGPIAENGPYQLGHHRNDSRSSARGGTLDRRLPAIPMADPTPPPPPACNEEEMDDTYDTIAPTKVPAQNKTEFDARTDTSDSKTDEGSLRYEPVRMGDEVYAEVTDIKKEPEEERRKSTSGVREVDEMYEEVGKHAAGMSKEEKRLSQMQRDRINRESPYSRLPGDESELSGDGVIMQRPPSQVETLPLNPLPRAQSDEVYEMYDTVADESVRNSRSFNSQEEGLFEDDNYASVDPPPPVPDRQYSPEEITSHSSGAQSPSSPVRNDRNSVVLPPLVGPGAALSVSGDASMSDPPYSQVTARESLASIRERQNQGRSPPVVNEYDSVDNVYEPVDDQPETNRNHSNNLPAADGAGDWYSEIDCTATARPSVEVGGGLYSDIDATSPELQDIAYIDEDPVVVATSPVETRGRAFTTGSVPNNVDDLYTDVDLSKKTSRRPPENLPVSRATEDVHPYAVVDKSKKMKNRAKSNENTPPIASPESYNDIAGRPKIKTFTEVCGMSEVPGNESLDSTGYQTVDEVKLQMRSGQDADEQTVKSLNGHPPNSFDEQAEPGYATVADDDDDIDAMYDEINLENGNSGNGATASEGVKEQMFHMSNHKVPEDFWVRQEPVYSEVDEDDSPEATIIPVTVL